jgi:hypothetical protein
MAIVEQVRNTQKIDLGCSRRLLNREVHSLDDADWWARLS